MDPAWRPRLAAVQGNTPAQVPSPLRCSPGTASTHLVRRQDSRKLPTPPCRSSSPVWQHGLRPGSQTSCSTQAHGFAGGPAMCLAPRQAPPGSMAPLMGHGSVGGALEAPPRRVQSCSDCQTCSCLLATCSCSAGGWVPMGMRGSAEQAAEAHVHQTARAMLRAGLEWAWRAPGAQPGLAILLGPTESFPPRIVVRSPVGSIHRASQSNCAYSSRSNRSWVYDCSLSAESAQYRGGMLPRRWDACSPTSLPEGSFLHFL